MLSCFLQPMAKLQLDFHSRGQQLCKFFGTKGSFYVTKESNPHNTGRHFFVFYTNVISVAVVVQFYLWFKFYLSLFWGMVMYDNKFKSRREFFCKRSIKPLILLKKQFLEVVSSQEILQSQLQFIFHPFRFAIFKLNLKPHHACEPFLSITFVTLITFGTNSLLYLGPFK